MSLVKIVLTFKFAILIFLSNLAKAQTIQFRSGPEFEFTHSDLLAAARKENRRGDHMLAGDEFQFAIKFSEEVKAMCAQSKNCKIERVKGKWSEADYKVTFDNGFWFKISYDPATVEIQAKPLFLTEWIENRDLVQHFIFDVAKKLDLYVDGLSGTGHFNFDFNQAFANNPKRFLKFFVLLANNSELFSGVLGLDLLNAPAVSELSQKSRDALKQLVELVQKEQLVPEAERKFKTARDIAKYIQKYVYTSHPYKSKGANEKREQAYNIMEPAENSDPNRSVPSEVRGLNAQESPEQYEAVHDFFQELVNYSEKTKNDIWYANKDISKYGPKELFNRFYALTRQIYPDDKVHSEKWKTLRTLLSGEMARLRPDALLAGTVNWNFKSNIQLVESYFEDSVHNEFVRKMLIKALNEGLAASSLEAQRLAAAYFSEYQQLTKQDKGFKSLEHTLKLGFGKLLCRSLF